MSTRCVGKGKLVNKISAMTSYVIIMLKGSNILLPKAKKKKKDCLEDK